MLVIPAIDLRHGRCVRLRQGRYEEETVYFDDPVRMAKLWRVMNAKVLHVVDLDAARTAAPDGAAAPSGDGAAPDGPSPEANAPEAPAGNRAVIAGIVRALDIPVEVGGGVRTMADVEELLGLGVYRVVLGTTAVREPEVVEEAVRRFGCGRIVVGIDARDGEVRVEGWERGSGVDAVELAVAMEERGVRRFIYTDVARDGMLAGPNVEAYRAMSEKLTRARITASGGVSGYLDLLALRALEPRVDSVVVGRALYENRFPCQQFWCWHQKDGVNLDAYSTAPLAAPPPAPAAEAVAPPAGPACA
jgi:phosphoribosylformimino-5-aminoimidazole carboxamide ribotide isomerase